jgi:cytochrome c oxidase subunit 2
VNLFLAACVLALSCFACRKSGDGNRAPPPPTAAREALFDPHAPLEVQAIGHKYHWTFRYAGTDGQFDTADDIQRDEEFQVPANHDIRLHIKSRDYVYVFSIPELGLRQIGVPDLTYSIGFHTRNEGVFTLKTDPMCGFRLLHDDDMGEMRIAPLTDFQTWLAGRDETIQ